MISLGNITIELIDLNNKIVDKIEIPLTKMLPNSILHKDIFYTQKYWNTYKQIQYLYRTGAQK